MARRFAFVLGALVAGCSSGGSPGTPSGADPATLTYYKDVKPLVEEKCLGCHVEGAIAPFSLTTYDDVAAHKQEIRVAVANRVMPPWLAGKGCNEYQHDRSLSDDEIATITGWVDQGAAAGDPASYVAPAPADVGGLSRVDRTLMMASAYTPQQSPDEYRCFLLDWPESADTFVTGFRARPGNSTIVHHVIAYLAPPDQVAGYQQLDDADPAPGYLCFGGPGNTSGLPEWVGSWAPGSQGNDFAPDTGIEIPAGSKIVLQVHYNTASTLAAPDQTALDFSIAPSVAKQAMTLPWANPAWVRQHTMNIPAGQPDVMHDFSFDVSSVLDLLSGGVFQSSQPFTVYATALHMHTRGTHAKVDLVRADGSDTCLLDVPRWDFHWQSQYAFTQPTVYQPGDQVHLECHWDASTSTADLNWGEGTGDEMCLTTLYVTQ